MDQFKAQRVVVVGTGYVGLVTGTCLAHVGHDVTCVDIDADKVRRMQAGEVPIYEPGLESLFREALASRRLGMTTDLAEAVAKDGIVFLALPTPQGADGAADLSAVLAVADTLGPLLRRPTVVVTKSTVPVGTGDKIAANLRASSNVTVDIVSNPEFLREGLAVQDCLQPDRIVIGTSSKSAMKLMRQLYAPYISRPEQLVEMDLRSAELTKYAANSFLAMKVSFINEIANLCERVGADVEAVRRGIGPDERIGSKFLQAGIGYGGSCFPKDVEALLHTSRENDYAFHLLESIVTVNQRQKLRLYDKLLDYYDGALQGKHFVLWGLAFKPDTDDIRESPALYLIELLLQAGASITAYDPHAAENVRRQLGDRAGLSYADDKYGALSGADALLIVTEWQEFRDADLQKIQAGLSQSVVFDGRNIYDPAKMKKLGFSYTCIGRAYLD